MSRLFNWNALLAPLAAATFAASPVAAQPAPQAPVYELTQVAGSVWRFRSNAHYGLVMITPKGAVVVDPLNAAAARWLKDELARRFKGLKVAKVVYSHHDWDHATGAAEFGPVPVISRVETLKELQPPVDPAARERFVKQFGAVVKPTQTYAGKMMRVTLGGKTVELHAQPSRHATDLSFVWFPAEKVLFTVDVISPHRLPYRTLDDYEPTDVEQTLKAALSYNARYVVGGHGIAGTPQSVRDLGVYYADLRKGVADGIARGLSLEAIQTDLMLDKYRDWMDYEAFRAMNIAGMYRYLTQAAK